MHYQSPFKIRPKDNFGLFLLTTPSNVLPLHLKQTFPLIVWIFTEGEWIESRLPFKIFSTLYVSAKSTEWQDWFGPSGRYVKNYDINKIESSQAYAALSDIGRNLPFVRKILELRKNATIYCQKEERNSSINILSKVVLVVEVSSYGFFVQKFKLLAGNFKFIVVLILVGNQGNHQNWVPSMLTYKFWLIFMGMKQKKKSKWPTQKN